MAGGSRGLKGSREGAPRRDADGVRVVATPGIRKGVWALALAALFAGAALIALLRRDAGAPAPPAPVAAQLAKAAEPPRPQAVSQRAREPRPAPAAPEAPPAPAQPPAPEEPPAHEDPPVGIGPPGSGLALFPPPGTVPLLRGIVVPEDFPLPEGYVRHHQVTDDGEALPAILMFHPDYELLDAAGEPIAVPGDRVVPPELAPPGLPLQMLELPGGGEPDSAP
jgi:hypothetical protein